MRITITGGAGYIGSILTPALLAAGHKVRVLDAFIFGQDSLMDCCDHPDFEVMRGDCRIAEVVKKAICGADFILPLAALVGAPQCDLNPVGARTTNFDAISMLLGLRAPEQKIIFPCTNSGYGIGKPGSVCDEDSPMTPLSLYAESKVSAETLVLASENAMSLRLATVFGASPRMRTDLLVNDFVLRAVQDRGLLVFEGSFKRNYIHVRDVARAFIHGIEHFDAMKGRAYNVGLSGCNFSKLELCARIKQYIPNFFYIEVPMGRDPDKRDYIVSNARIEATGFLPIYTLGLGIEELLKAYTILRPKRYVNV